MKFSKAFLTISLLASLAVVPFAHSAEDAAKKPKPYILKTCLVSDEKLGGDMGDPYVFIYGATKTDPGREIKLCCKSCLKDFDKDTKKLIKKLDEAEAKAKKEEAKSKKDEPKKDESKDKKK